VELLKLRFGEAQMHYCEVMLKVTIFSLFFLKNSSPGCLSSLGKGRDLRSDPKRLFEECGVPKIALRGQICDRQKCHVCF